MTLRKAIFFGAILLVLLNFLGLFAADIIWLQRALTLIVITALCLFIYFLDITKRSPNTFYELGFIYTLMSIIISMIFASFDEGLSFELILSSFAISLITSVFGMVLKVVNDEPTLDSSFENYNRSLIELITNIRIASEDVLKSSNTFASNLNEQSEKFGYAINQFQRDVSVEISKIDEAINKQETDFSEIKKGLDATNDSVSKTKEQIGQLSTAVNGAAGKFEKIINEGFVTIHSETKSFNVKYELIRTDITGINSELSRIKENIDEANSNEEIKNLINYKERHLEQIILDLGNKITEIKSSIDSIDNKSIKSSLADSSRVLQEISIKLSDKDEKIVNELNGLIKEIKQLKISLPQRSTDDTKNRRSLLDILLFRK